MKIETNGQQVPFIDEISGPLLRSGALFQAIPHFVLMYICAVLLEEQSPKSSCCAKGEAHSDPVGVGSVRFGASEHTPGSNSAVKNDST